MAINSCTSALELAAILTGLAPGDEVIMPAHTYVASAVPFARHGVTIRWADIDPETRVVSAETISPLVSDRTKAVVVVQLYGLPADMDPIMALAAKHGFTVVEDCAQAPGALYKVRRVGSIGDFGSFYFQTHKNMQPLGEGDMLAVQNIEHGVQARRMRWMGNWTFDGKREKAWVRSGCNLVEPIPGQWPVNYCGRAKRCSREDDARPAGRNQLAASPSRHSLNEWSFGLPGTPLPTRPGGLPARIPLDGSPCDSSSAVTFLK